MRKKCWLNSLKEIYRSEDLGLGGMIILKKGFKETGRKVVH